MSPEQGPRLEPLPAALRSTVSADLRPVRPQAQPHRRALRIALPILVAIGTAGLVWTTRGGGLGMLGLALVEWLGGLALLALALREAVPARSSGGSRAALLLGAGGVLSIAVAVSIWQLAGAGLGNFAGLRHAAVCLGIETLLALVPLAIALVLALRSLAPFPGRSGALAGAAAGLFADAFWQLICTRRDLAHQLAGHSGALGVMLVLGLLAGMVAGRFGHRGSRANRPRPRP